MGALDPFKGVELELDYELVEPRLPRSDRYARSDTKFEELKTNPAVEGLGMNTPHSIESNKSEAINNTPLPAAPSRTNLVNRERLKVEISVPSSLVLSRAKRKVRDPSDFEQLFSSLKASILASVQGVLPSEDISPGQFPVHVTLRDQPSLDNGMGSNDLLESIKQNGASVAVILVSCMLLIVVGRKTPQDALPAEEMELPPASEVSGNANGAGIRSHDRRREAEEQLSRLIDSDPEIAAQVMKGWIKNEPGQ